MASPRLQFPLRHLYHDDRSHEWRFRQGKAPDRMKFPLTVEPWRHGMTPQWWTDHLQASPPTPRVLTAAEQTQVDEVLRQLRGILARSLDRSIDLFLQWDRDNSGRIDKAEFRMALAALGISAAKRAIDDTFESFDTDRSGSLDYRELHRRLRRTTADVAFKEAWRSPRAARGPAIAPAAAPPEQAPSIVAAAVVKARDGRRAEEFDPSPRPKVDAWRAQKKLFPHHSAMRTNAVDSHHLFGYFSEWEGAAKSMARDAWTTPAPPPGPPPERLARSGRPQPMPPAMSPRSLCPPPVSIKLAEKITLPSGLTLTHEQYLALLTPRR